MSLITLTYQYANIPSGTAYLSSFSPTEFSLEKLSNLQSCRCCFNVTIMSLSLKVITDITEPSARHSKYWITRHIINGMDYSLENRWKRIYVSTFNVYTYHRKHSINHYTALKAQNQITPVGITPKVHKNRAPILIIWYIYFFRFHLFSP
jgi:hypothetical protein